MDERKGSNLDSAGIPPSDVKHTATERAKGVMNYIVMLIALGRDNGLGCQDMVDWIHAHYAERGYYEEWLATHGAGNVDAFLRDFLSGRGLLYEASTFRSLDSGGYEVLTPSWYQRDLPEAFFFFDVDPDEFSQYVQILGRSHAQRLGIDLELKHEGGFERAVIRRLPEDRKDPAARHAKFAPSDRRTAPGSSGSSGRTGAGPRG